MLLQLPTDPLKQILSKLSTHDLGRLETVCREMRSLSTAGSDDIWEGAVRRGHGHELASSAYQGLEVPSYRAAAKLLHEVMPQIKQCLHNAECFAAARTWEGSHDYYRAVQRADKLAGRHHLDIDTEKKSLARQAGDVVAQRQQMLAQSLRLDDTDARRAEVWEWQRGVRLSASNDAAFRLALANPEGFVYDHMSGSVEATEGSHRYDDIWDEQPPLHL